MEQLEERVLTPPSVTHGLGSMIQTGTDLVVSLDKNTGTFNYAGRTYSSPFADSKLETRYWQTHCTTDAYLTVIETSLKYLTSTCKNNSRNRG